MNVNKENNIVELLLKEKIVNDEDRQILDMIVPERLNRLYEVLKERTRYVSILLEAVDDGHNQAAVLRSAEAFGVQNVTVVTGRAPFAPNELVTKSADKWLTIDYQSDISAAISQLKKKGYQIYVSHLSEQAVPLEKLDVSRPTVLVFGNEHSGVSKEAVDMADRTFVIPMKGFVQSLNISVAAALSIKHITDLAKGRAGAEYYLTLEEKQEIFRDWMLKSLNNRLRKIVAQYK
ncbi:TrmH family RNA methyltransferase [Aeribacillus composti]|uniref:TrmH family RNA methyltransferase n=1 Tax=Aeribacillus TaxID=1055323 RepID=UPI002E218533|nr:RNA methyltransferase [Aeribacillus composti]